MIIYRNTEPVKAYFRSCRIWLREQVEVDRRLRNEVFARVDAQSVDLLKECPTCAALL